MQQPDLSSSLYQPYVRADGAAHYGPVHTAVKAESPSSHWMAQLDLERNPAYHGGAYLGFGGWVNLGYIAATRPMHAVLADINPLQAIYWQFHLNLLATAPDMDAYLRGMPAMLREAA